MKGAALPQFAFGPNATTVALQNATGQGQPDARSLEIGRTVQTLMTEAFPESVQVRLSVSSATIGDLFTLRCELREHMIDWLRTTMPDALIRHRLEVPGGYPKADEVG